MDEQNEPKLENMTVDQLVQGVASQVWQNGRASAFMEYVNEMKRRLQSEARWIPVSELPEVKKDTLFLCAFKDFQDKWKVDTRTFWVDSKYFSGSCKIEFYMPLPTPQTEG